ncbi:hypothetical protein GCM10027598_19960 [Amycolatopsis oliviviridis]|uniref:Uncharacterized protein n=1 Tax=Amycolatopsis oliviviridis TaxID=1471590 RepID=A0ABQ3LF17_9PSEU|nr:hypothetical protein GCM10017790_27610 [Amycolatopsis oliviviridis]
MVDRAIGDPRGGRERPDGDASGAALDDETLGHVEQPVQVVHAGAGHQARITEQLLQNCAVRECEPLHAPSCHIGPVAGVNPANHRDRKEKPK